LSWTVILATTWTGIGAVEAQALPAAAACSIICVDDAYWKLVVLPRPSLTVTSVHGCWPPRMSMYW
jgi:hypothetical protein